MKQNQRKFDQLKELLEMKREETPPSNFFQHFSDRVISRIEEQSTHRAKRTWSSFLKEYDVKPLISCVYGFAIGGLLLVGFQFSKVMESELAISPFDEAWPAIPTVVGQIDIPDTLEGFRFPSIQNERMISSISPLVFSPSVVPFLKNSKFQNTSFFVE